MQTADAVVRFQTLEGRWETCGVDRLRGVWPESLRLEANSWGADTANFNLKRDPSAIWPDIAAFTPIEIEIGGLVVWDGFISQTPTTDNDGGSVSIQCKGWQYHLDDDSFERVWVSAMFSQWKDAREYQATPLRIYRPGGVVNTGDGCVTLGWQRDGAIDQNTYAAVIFDAGPENTISAVSMNWSVDSGATLGSTSTIKMYARGSNSLTDLHSTSNIAINGVAMGALGSSSGTRGGTLTASRYVLVGLKYEGTATAATLDYLVKINNLSVAYSSASYNATSKVITGPLASDVVKDVLPKAPLLDQSTTNVSTTSFAIPHFATIDGGRTPREYIDAVNAYHNYIAKIGPGKSMIFKEKPTAPSVVIGNWGGSQFEDAAANSGDEIYNKVVVEGTGPDGLPIRLPRVASNLPFKSTPPYYVDPALFNGTFSSVSNWTVNDGTKASIATTTTNAISGTSGKWTVTNAGGTEYSLTASMSAGYTFLKGLTYTATLYMKSYTASLPDAFVYPQLTFGRSSVPDTATTSPNYDYGVAGNSYAVSVSWTPTADRASSTVTLKLTLDQSLIDAYVIQPSDYFILDDLTISYSKPTIPDKRGFTRTKRLQVPSVVTSSSASQLGDVFLASKLATPLKGSVDVTGSGARDYLSGAAIHPSQLLLEVGEKLHLSHRIDPDTGGIGRDGDIASVSYNHDSQSATVSIDSQRNRFESLLSRLSVVTDAKVNR